MMYEAVIFDKDGVLVNSEPELDRRRRAFFAEEGIDDSGFPDFYGSNNKVVWGCVEPHDTARRAELYERFRKRFRDDPMPYRELATPGVHETLTALREAGVRTGLASASPPLGDRRLCGVARDRRAARRDGQRRGVRPEQARARRLPAGDGAARRATRADARSGGLAGGDSGRPPLGRARLRDAPARGGLARPVPSRTCVSPRSATWWASPSRPSRPDAGRGRIARRACPSGAPRASRSPGRFLFFPTLSRRPLGIAGVVPDTSTNRRPCSAGARKSPPLSYTRPKNSRNCRASLPFGRSPRSKPRNS